MLRLVEGVCLHRHYGRREAGQCRAGAPVGCSTAPACCLQGAIACTGPGLTILCQMRHFDYATLQRTLLPFGALCRMVCLESAIRPPNACSIPIFEGLCAGML
jgi:hypothetical protein